MCFELILGNSHLQLKGEAGYLLAGRQDSKLSGFSRVRSAGSFCPLDPKRPICTFLCIFKCQNHLLTVQMKAQLPCQCVGNLTLPTPFHLEAKAALASPHPSAGASEIRTCRSILFKKKMKQHSSLNLEKLTIYSLHSEPHGGLIKNINLLG